jgi:hypothetical protein
MDALKYPDSYPGYLRFPIEPVLDDMVTATRPALRAAMAAVLLLLVIACANATALVVARLRTRRLDLAIHDVGPGRAVGDVAMLSDNVRAAMSTLVAVTGLVTFLAVIAGLLSAVGLYIVIAFIVHEQRRSAAIRTALGATSGQVMWAYLKTGGIVMAGAVAVGVVFSVGAASFFSELRYGVPGRDPMSLTLAVVISLIVSAMAMLLPALRAARANIVSILREA